MPECDEMPCGEALLREMHNLGVKAVAIHPKTNGWNLLFPETDTLFGSLSTKKIPVFLSRSEFDNFNDLTEILIRHPSLAVILTGVRWTEQRQILPLLRRFRNLHITFDNFQINFGPEDLIAAGLEDQLIFGSNAPAMSAGAHRTYIDLAEIPEEAARKIAAA